MALHTIVEHDSTHIKPYIDAKIGNFTGKNSDNEPYVLRQGLGNLADMDLVGGSLVWNQLVQNGNFADTTGWTINATDSAVISASNNELTITTSVFNGGVFQKISQAISGHKCLQSIDVKNTKAIRIGYGNSAKNITDSHSSFTNVSSVFDSVNTNGAFIIYSTVDSSENIIVVKNAIFIDLTVMFGPTIADYIYSLEQATAGAGVAWFRKYFPNAYYGYQSGKIESVNVASRKVVGKNLLPNNASSLTTRGVTFTVNSDGTIQAIGTASSEITLFIAGTNWGYSNSFKNLLQKGRSYILSGGNTHNQRLELSAYNPDGNAVIPTPYTGNTGDVTFSIPSDAQDNIGYLVYVRITSGETVNFKFKPMIRFATIEDDTYEPYQSSTYAFDSSKQLRGIFYLDANNKLCANGDIYKADGSITRKKGYEVCDGDENWQGGTALTNVFRAYMNLPNGMNSTNAEVRDFTNYLPYLNDYNSDTEHYYIYNQQIYVFLTAANITEFKAKLASKPLQLIYTLITPTTENAELFQNPQRAFTDGTEEFIDAGVTAGTRDVSIPVGNNTTYQLNETLPPIEDYVDGAVQFKAAISALGTDESGRTTASRAYTAGEFFYKDEKMYKVLTSIAQGATFTINTNCQQTTLFAELKALAQ